MNVTRLNVSMSQLPADVVDDLHALTICDVISVDENMLIKIVKP